MPSRRILRDAVTDRLTLGIAAVLLAMWVGFDAGVGPGELYAPLFPALAAAFFLDTVAYNQFGLRLPWLFYALGVVCLYAEAACLGAAVRWVRRRRRRRRPSDRSERA